MKEKREKKKERKNVGWAVIEESHTHGETHSWVRASSHALQICRLVILSHSAQLIVLVHLVQLGSEDVHNQTNKGTSLVCVAAEETLR